MTTNHRIVSPIENYSVGRHQVDFYRCVTFFLRFQLKTNEKFVLNKWKSLIERSIQLSIVSQPRLSLQVDLERKSPWFIILPSNIFDQLPIEFIEKENEDFLLKILENEVNRRFEYNQNSFLWRVTILYDLLNNSFDFVVSLNHAIADGISGMAFLRTFTDHLAERVTTTYSLNNDRPSFELIPSRLPPISSLLSSIVEKLLLPKCFRRYFFPKTYWTGDQRPIDDPTNETRLISLSFSPIEFRSFHQQCRNQRTTLNSAILSAVLLALLQTYADGNSMEFFCNTAVNIRRYCQPPVLNEQMGVFVSSADSHHFLRWKDEDSIETFWPLARQIREQVEEQLEHSVLPLVQSLNYVSDWKKLLIDQRDTLPNGYQHSVDLSNLLAWKFDFDENFSWKIIDAGFCQSSNRIGSALTISVVTVNEYLRICFTFNEKSLKRIDEFRRHFLQICRTCGAIG